jgi:hypothetical protein
VTRYFVRIHFSETVRAETRRFTHDIGAEASSSDEAIRLALDHFTDLGQESWVGWIRTVEKVEVERVPRGEVLQDVHAFVKPRPKPDEAPA